MDLPKVQILFLMHGDCTLVDHTCEYLDLACMVHYLENSLCAFFLAGLNAQTKASLERTTFHLGVKRRRISEPLYSSLVVPSPEVPSPVGPKMGFIDLHTLEMTPTHVPTLKLPLAQLVPSSVLDFLVPNNSVALPPMLVLCISGFLSSARQRCSDFPVLFRTSEPMTLPRSVDPSAPPWFVIHQAQESPWFCHRLPSLRLIPTPLWLH